MELAQPASATPWSRYSNWTATDWKDYNTLVKTASPAYAPPPKLEGPIAGDPKNGEKLAFDRTRGGSCVACHVMGKSTPALPGNVGPDLSTIGIWGRSDQWLFNYVYDPRSVNPQSMMPPWGSPPSLQHAGNPGHRGLPENAQGTQHVQGCAGEPRHAARFRSIPATTWIPLSTTAWLRWNAPD